MPFGVMRLHGKSRDKKKDTPPPEVVEPPLHDRKCPVGGKLEGDYPAVAFCNECEQRSGCPAWEPGNDPS